MIPKRTVATVAAATAIVVAAACSNGGGETAATTTAPPRVTPEPTARPTTTDPSASTEPMVTLGPQYWPGELWPPPEPLGWQYWPGTEHWPPPRACFPDAGICMEQDETTASTGPPAPTTTVASPTTTSFELTDVQEAVLAQVGATEAAYDAALRKPYDASLMAAIEAATAEGSPARDEFVSAYRAIIGRGQWAVPDPEIRNSVTPEADPLLTPDGMAALVLVCVVSGDSLMELDASGNARVVSDVRNAHRIAQLFVLNGDTWRLSERHLIATFPEATTCDPGPAESASPQP